MFYMNSKFGKNLRLARVNKSYTQEQLANIIGVSKQSIAMYENNKRAPKNEALIKITEALEVSMDFLFGTQNNTPSELNELTKSTDENSSSVSVSSFSIRLNELLKTASQKEMSEKTGLSQSSISLYIAGKRKPASDAIIKIANFFNVSADYLLGISDNPSKSGEMSDVMLDIQKKAEKYDDLKRKLQRLAGELDEE